MRLVWSMMLVVCVSKGGLLRPLGGRALDGHYLHYPFQLGDPAGTYSVANYNVIRHTLGRGRRSKERSDRMGSGKWLYRLSMTSRKRRIGWDKDIDRQ